MLHLHRSTRADGLLDALGSLLAEPPDDPFAPEVISVPTRGMERWIAQQLSSRLGTAPGATDGVCANVVFPTPRRLVGEALNLLEPGSVIGLVFNRDERPLFGFYRSHYRQYFRS